MNTDQCALAELIKFSQVFDTHMYVYYMLQGILVWRDLIQSVNQAIGIFSVHLHRYMVSV